MVDKIYPTPQKGHGTWDQEGTWHQRYLPPTPWTNTCENITFPQLRWLAVKIRVPITQHSAHENEGLPLSQMDDTLETDIYPP